MLSVVPGCPGGCQGQALTFIFNTQSHELMAMHQSYIRNAAQMDIAATPT